MHIETTKEEDAAIAALKRVAKRWPKSIWLFSASGNLCVMKTNEQGKAVYTESGGVDQDYVVATINIKNDGGDW